MRIGQYYNVSLLAESSFGYIYKARRPGVEGPIALQVATIPSATQEALDNLAEECRLYFQFQHHKIVQFNEPLIDYENKRVEVELEYMPNGTLEQYIISQHGKQIPEVEIWQIIGDIAEGLAHLHSRVNGRAPITHCDLRPVTILRKKNTFKLAFFKLSRFITRKARRKSTIDAGIYVAPETMRWQACGPSADIWSFGLIIMDLTTTLTRQEGITSHDLSSINLSGYSETLTWLVHACLLINPTERITAAEIFSLAPTQQAARAAIYNATLTSKLPVDYLSESLSYIDFFRSTCMPSTIKPMHQAFHPLDVVATPHIELHTDSMAPEADLGNDFSCTKEANHGRDMKLPSTPSEFSTTESENISCEYGEVVTSLCPINSPSTAAPGVKDIISTKIRLLSLSPYEAITTSLATGNSKLLFMLFSHIYKYKIKVNMSEIFKYQSQHLIEAKDKTPLMWAAHLGAIDTVNKSLNLVRHVHLGNTALMFAASAGKIECVKLLLCEIAIQKHTSANVLTHVGGWTALMKAAENGHTITAELLLLEAGARKADGMTALMLAAQANHPDCVQLLIAAEAGMQDQDGWTALMYAAHSGSLTCVQLLLEHEQSMVTDNGQTALGAAIRSGHKQCIRALFSVEGNLRDDTGRLIYETVLSEMRGIEADEAKQYMELAKDVEASV